MTVQARGKVFIGTKTNGVFPPEAQFTFDPKISREWPSRKSVLPGVGGTVTVQDFGLFAKDMKLTLTSETNWCTAAFKAYIDGLRSVRGAVYDYQDYEGTVGQVTILDFQTRPTFVRDGSLVLYEYTLVLQMVTLTQLAGVAYTGS